METWDSLLHIYKFSMGNFGLDNYTRQGSKGEVTIWCFFVITSFLTSILFFNMLINIMGQSLTKLTPIRGQVET